MKKMKSIVKIIIPRKYHGHTKYFLSYFKSLKYFGLKYQCNICRGHFSKFLPMGINNKITNDIIGGGYRFALCPRCFSTDRERLIYLYFMNKTNILKSATPVKLLHIAPEKNLRNIFKTNHKIEYINGDLNPLKAEKVIDVTNIQFHDNYFDFIICNHLLEHIQDDRKAMCELFRVLKPEGFAILQVPISKKAKETFEDFSITSPGERKIYFGQKDHVRIYGKDYKERLESVGFKVNLYDIKNDLSI